MSFFAFYIRECSYFFREALIFVWLWFSLIMNVLVLNRLKWKPLVLRLASRGNNITNLSVVDFVDHYVLPWCDNHLESANLTLFICHCKLLTLFFQIRWYDVEQNFFVPCFREKFVQVNLASRTSMILIKFIAKVKDLR